MIIFKIIAVIFALRIAYILISRLTMKNIMRAKFQHPDNSKQNMYYSRDIFGKHYLTTGIKFGYRLEILDPDQLRRLGKH